MIREDDISEYAGFADLPPFVQSGIRFARPDTERGTGWEDRATREAAILAFVATWEALQLPGKITDRREVELIARYAQTEIQNAFLRRLADQ